MKRTLLVLTLAIAMLLEAIPQVYQWRGPERDGIFNESGLLKEWPEEGPGLLFQVNGLGNGYSSPIVTDQGIFITGKIDSSDFLTSLTLEGVIRWQVPYGKSWDESYPETRSSPTIEGNSIYILSGSGVASCLDAETGELKWSVDVDSKFESDRHTWGVSESLLIVDDLVICTPGGKKTSVVALDKRSGETVWESESLGSQRSYASPRIYEFGGNRYILAVTARHLVCLNPADGAIVWKFNYFDVQEWTHQPGLIWANSPVFRDDEIFISKGYDHPAVMLKVAPDGKSAEQKFIDRTFDNHHHGVVLVGDYLYGSNWRSNSKGLWVCMDWETGKIMWEHDWISKGSIVYADGMLYTYVERNGAVGLVKPDPSGFKLVSTFRVTEGTGPHWAHPYIHDGKLYLRHGEYLMAYNIKDSK